MKNYVFTIDRTFDFCYGHRVYTQQLDVKYSLDGCLKCRHLHGHQGTIKLFLAADKLENNMVTDFKHTNIFKKFVDDILDHKFILGIKDPLFNNIVPEAKDHLIKDNNYDFWVPDMVYFEKTYDRNIPERLAVLEKLEGLVVVDFCPTSENLCKFLLEVAEKMLEGLGVIVARVEYWETPKSHCAYINPKLFKD